MTAALGAPEREMLVILRRKIAAQIDDGCGPAQLAALVRQFREIDKEIRGLDAAAAELDEENDDGSSSAEFDVDAI
jgi:trans-aconitate methyltransferase